MTRRLFGTDGIRGVANVDPMTGEVAMQLGRAIAHLFKEVKGRHRIVVGKDRQPIRADGDRRKKTHVG